MRVRKLLLVFLLVVGVAYLWYNWHSIGTSDQGIKITATPVKSIVYNNYPWLTGTEVVRVIYSYPRHLVNTTYFFVELEIPDEVVNYLTSLLNVKYADITPKDGLIIPAIFAAKASYGGFDYARVFNYRVIENTTDGIPKRIVVTLYVGDVPQDYNLLIVEFFRPYHEFFLKIPYNTNIEYVGQVVGDYLVEKREWGPSIRIEADSIWSRAIKASAWFIIDPRVTVLSREVYIPIYGNDSLFIKADYACGGQCSVGIAIGLLLVMKDGSRRIVSFEDRQSANYYADVPSATDIPVCTIAINLREFQSVRALIERNCGINWEDISHISRIYLGLNCYWYSDLALHNFFIGYLT